MKVLKPKVEATFVKTRTPRLQRIRFEASEGFQVVALHDDSVEIRFEVEELHLDVGRVPDQLTDAGYEPNEVDEIVESMFVTATKIQAMKILKAKMTIPRK